MLAEQSGNRLEGCEPDQQEDSSSSKILRELHRFIFGTVPRSIHGLRWYAFEREPNKCWDDQQVI